MARTKQVSKSRKKKVKIPNDAAVWKDIWSSNIRLPWGPPTAPRKETEKAFGECHEFIPKWIEKLSINDKINLYNYTNGKLQQTTVTNITDNHIQCYIRYHREIYLKKSNKSLFQLNSKTLQYMNHSNASTNLSYAVKDKIIYYKSNKDIKPYLFIIFKGLHETSNAYIYQYDIENNAWSKYCDFPKDFHPFFAKYTWNKRESKIYFVLETLTDIVKCAIFDINDKQWTVLNYKCDKLDDFYGIFKIFYIPFEGNSKLNEIHVITDFGSHFKFNPYKYPKVKKIYIVEDAKIDNCMKIMPSFLDFHFIESQRKLFQIWRSKNSTKLFACDIRPNQKKIKWENVSYKNKITYDRSICDTLVYDNIIFIFYKNHIRCFDTLTHKLIESDKLFAHQDFQLDKYWYSVVANNGTIHLIKSLSMTHSRVRHISLSLMNLIPETLCKEIGNKNNLLTVGYIRQFEKGQSNGIYLPGYLKKLILSFYPAFLF